MPIPGIADTEPNLAAQLRKDAAERWGSANPILSGHSLFTLAVICDLVEENWPSMDLVGDILLTCLRNDEFEGIKARRIRPPMSRRLTATPLRSSRFAFNLDRIVNRFWDYPRFLRRYRNAAYVFHVVDHSYAQLVLELPARRTLVTCHDIDTFRCLVEPENDVRSAPFRAMVRRTLRGLQMAALVVCPSTATRDAL